MVCAKIYNTETSAFVPSVPSSGKVVFVVQLLLEMCLSMGENVYVFDFKEYS